MTLTVCRTAVCTASNQRCRRTRQRQLPHPRCCSLSARGLGGAGQNGRPPTAWRGDGCACPSGCLACILSLRKRSATSPIGKATLSLTATSRQLYGLHARGGDPLGPPCTSVLHDTAFSVHRKCGSCTENAVPTSVSLTACADRRSMTNLRLRARSLTPRAGHRSRRSNREA
jgi:hypothetical protein